MWKGIKDIVFEITITIEAIFESIFYKEEKYYDSWFDSRAVNHDDSDWFN